MTDSSITKFQDGWHRTREAVEFSQRTDTRYVPLPGAFVQGVMDLVDFMESKHIDAPHFLYSVGYNQEDSCAVFYWPGPDKNNPKLFAKALKFYPDYYLSFTGTYTERRAKEEPYPYCNKEIPNDILKHLPVSQHLKIPEYYRGNMIL